MTGKARCDTLARHPGRRLHLRRRTACTRRPQPCHRLTVPITPRPVAAATEPDSSHLPALRRRAFSPYRARDTTAALRCTPRLRASWLCRHSWVPWSLPPVSARRSSGFRASFLRTPRQFDAGVFTTGRATTQSGNLNIVIPPKAEFTIYGLAPPACTARLSRPMNVFGVFQHAHLSATAYGCPGLAWVPPPPSSPSCPAWHVVI